MHIPSIKIFATDFKNRDNWNLPFIRIGTTSECNSVLHDKTTSDNIANFNMPFSEINTIWHIYSHFKDFGNPDYIGFCHYRRFFTIAEKKPIILISSGNIDNSIILSPEQQLSVMLRNNIDVIAPFPFLEHFRQDKNNINYTKPFSNIIEDSYLQGIDDKTGLSFEEYKLAFDNLLHYAKNDIMRDAIIKSFNDKAVFFGTIFTSKREIFYNYMNVVFPAIFKTFCDFSKDRILNMNWRVGGYLLERLTSVYIHALQKLNYKICSLPLVVTNCNDAATYRNYLTKDKLDVKYEDFKRHITDAKII